MDQGVMANQEHLGHLKQRAAHWNQWRQGHPYITPGLHYLDLIKTDL